MFSNIERAVRFLRLRKGWPQRILGGRARVSREMISRLERGDVSGMTIGSLDKVANALGATLHVQVRWQGEQLDRLMDAAHAAIQQSVADLLTGLGWVVRVEVSFNHYGDRGRVDILAFHPRFRILVVIEVKTALGDLQDTLGRLDVKVRLGRQIARELAWNDATSIIPALVLGDSRLARRTIAAHEALFARYDVRGRGALAWLRRPDQAVPTGLLWFTGRADSHPATIRRGQRAPKSPNAHEA